MLKQTHSWQRALVTALILICVGIGLAHKVEAAIEPHHAEHCTICMMGCNAPALAEAPGLPNLANLSYLFSNIDIPSSPFGQLRLAYKTRAPPLV